MGIKVVSTGEFTVDANAAIDNFSAGTFTICAWFKPNITSWPASDTSRLSDKDDGTGGYSFILQRMTGASSGTARLRFLQYTTVTDGDWVTSSNVASWGATAPWQFAAVKRDGSVNSNDPTFWYNDAVAARTDLTTPAGSSADDSGANMRIANAYTLTRPYNGVLGLYQVYDRMLTDNELATKYRTGGADNNRYGLVCELLMREDAVGTTASQTKHRDTSATQGAFGAINSSVTFDADADRRFRRRRTG